MLEDCPTLASEPDVLFAQIRRDMSPLTIVAVMLAGVVHWAAYVSFSETVVCECSGKRPIPSEEDVGIGRYRQQDRVPQENKYLR